MLQTPELRSSSTGRPTNLGYNPCKIMFLVSALHHRKFLATATLLFACSVASAPVLRAQVERESTLATDWSMSDEHPVGSIQTKIAQGYRIVNMDYRRPGPTFSVSYVRNTGEYYLRGATWYYGTPAYISSQLSGKRITELEPYMHNNSTLYFAAAMVDNIGQQAKSWWWYYGSANYISSQISGKRIIDLDAYRVNGTVYYSALMIANTGADYRDWWWYPNVTEGFIVGRALGLGAQILDAERFGYGSSDEHCAVLARHPSEPVPGHAWYHWKTWDEVLALLAQNRARPVKVEYVGWIANGTQLFNLLLIENRGFLNGFGRSCAGTSGTPALSFSGTPRPGGYANFRLGNAESNQPVVLTFGFSKFTWGRTMLPISLSGLGAPGCYLYTDPTFAVPLATNSMGTLSWTMNVLPEVPYGTKLYAQMLCVDRRANVLGATTTSAVEIRIGQ